MAYDPLVMPTPPSTSPDFAATSLYLQRSANAIAKAATSFMDSLSELKAIDFSQVGDLPDFNSVVWLGSMQDAMVRPTRPTVDTSITDLLAQLNALVAPTAPSNTFAYTDTGYTSALRQPLIEKMLNDILNGS